MNSFEQIIDRHHTASLKWDSAVQRGKPADVLPLWVADMDHKAADPILDALHNRVSHGIFGYSEPDNDYNTAMCNWFRRRYSWEISPEWNTCTPGVVPALALAVQAYTRVGDPVLIEEPVYYPFRGVIEANGRKVVSVPLVRDIDGRYKRDINALGEAIKRHGIGLMFLCNPHNPVGRVWTPEELRALAEITVRHKVIVVSDEIHADLTYPEFSTTPFASLSPEVAELTVSTTSPSKSFNLAGLQLANVLISNPELRRKFRRALATFGYAHPSPLALVAAQAAFDKGEEWLDSLREHMAEMRDYVLERVAAIEGMEVVRQEGTYLMWIDCFALAARLGLDIRDLDKFFLQAGVWFDDGGMFGESGYGYTRINIACPRATLVEAFDRIERALA